MAKTKIKYTETKQQEEATPITKAIDEFLKVFDQIPWNYGLTSAESKACDVSGFARHFGFRED